MRPRRVGARRRSCALGRPTTGMSRRWPRSRPALILACLLLAGLVWLQRGGGDHSNDKVTVLLSAYQTQGLRPQWVRATAELYTSSPYHAVIDQVVLVWNGPDSSPPVMPKGVKIVRAARNSLNNR